MKCYWFAEWKKIKNLMPYQKHLTNGRSALSVQVWALALLLFKYCIVLCLSLFGRKALLTGILLECVFLFLRGRSLVKCCSFFSSSDGNSAIPPGGRWSSLGMNKDGVDGVWEEEELSSMWTGTSSRALSRSNSISAGLHLIRLEEHLSLAAESNKDQHWGVLTKHKIIRVCHP